MSIKYIRMMGLLNKDIKSEFIHIPIDNYIIDAARKEGIISDLFDVEGLGVQPNFSGKWSKITEYKDYLEYQKTSRKELQKRNCIPVVREADAWMAEGTVIEDRRSKGKQIGKVMIYIDDRNNYYG